MVDFNSITIPTILCLKIDTKKLKNVSSSIVILYYFFCVLQVATRELTMVSIKADMEIQLLPRYVLVPMENGFTLNGMLVKATSFEFTLTDGGVMMEQDTGYSVTLPPKTKITYTDGVFTESVKGATFENGSLTISGPEEGGTPVAGGAVKPAATARGAWATRSPAIANAGAGGSKPKAGSPKPEAGAGGSKPKAGSPKPEAGGSGWKTSKDTRRGAATGGGRRVRRGFKPKVYELEKARDEKDCIDLRHEGNVSFAGVDTSYGEENDDNFYAHVTNETGTKFKKFYFTKGTMPAFCEKVLGVTVPEGTFPFYVPREHYIEFRTIRQ